MVSVPHCSSSRRSRTNTNPQRIPEATLLGEINHLWQSSLAPNTRLAYDVGLSAYNSFCAQQGIVQSWPLTISLISQFIDYSSCNGHAAATARSYISAINYKCKSQSLPDLSNSFIISKLLEGFSLTKTKPDGHLPITLEVLCKIIGILPHCLL